MRKFALNTSFNVKVLLSCLALLWFVEFINIASGYQLNQYGIVPRNVVGLRGLIFSPFLHGSVQHLMLNSIPFLVLGFLVLARSMGTFLSVTFFVSVVGGLGVWWFGGQNSVHIGASGLIFGYFGYLVFIGVFSRKFGSFFISCVVFMLYGGLIWGVLPGKEGISWEGHLFGFLAGVLFAYLSRNSHKSKS